MGRTVAVRGQGWSAHRPRTRHAPRAARGAAAGLRCRMPRGGEGGGRPLGRTARTEGHVGEKGRTPSCPWFQADQVGLSRC